MKEKVYSGLKGIPRGNAKKECVRGCLVIEGGAFRGLYNQGVLDAFMTQDLNFSCTIGTSAGALAGMNYVAGQIGRSARANLIFRSYSPYIGLGALRRSHSLLNLNFLLEDYEAVEPFDQEAFDDPNRRFVAVATSCETGKTKYFEKGLCSDMKSALKASASLPFLSPMVKVEGEPCLDGGCSCKIAYEWAIKEGYEKIVVIRTRDRSFRKPNKEKQAAKRVYKKYKHFGRVTDLADVAYNAQCDELDRLEREGRIYVLAPSQPVAVSRLEKDIEKLGELYWLGYTDAMEKLEEIKEYLK